MLLPPTVVVVAVMMVAKIVYIMKRNNMSFFRGKKKKEAFSFLVLYSHFPNRNETMFHFHCHSHSILIHISFLSIKHCKVGIKLSSPFPPFHSCYQHHHDVESKYKNVRLREKEKKTDKKIGSLGFETFLGTWRISPRVT